MVVTSNRSPGVQTCSFISTRNGIVIGLLSMSKTRVGSDVKCCDMVKLLLCLYGKKTGL